MRAATAALNDTYKLQDHDRIIGHSASDYVLRVRDLPELERPREKLLAAGPQALVVAELLAIVWGTGTRREEVLAMAQRTLHEYGQKAVGSETDPRQLAASAGIPLNKACQLVAGFELGRRYYARRNDRPVQVRNAEQAAEYLQGMGHSAKEQLRGLYLNSRYNVIHDEVISVGSLTANIVHPREVFQPALEYGAVAVIIAHNHPSGSAEPTTADLEVTAQLKAAGQILGISLLDHLIVTTERCVSIMEEQ